MHHWICAGEKGCVATEYCGVGMTSLIAASDLSK